MSSPDSPARMLFARLQLADPAARTFLITSVRDESPVGEVAELLRKAIAEAGYPAAVSPETADASIRDSPRPSPGYTVTSAPGILSDGRTLLLAAQTDATVLVVKTGRTVRRELDTVRRELSSAGGTLAVAVLVD